MITKNRQRPGVLKKKCGHYGTTSLEVIKNFKHYVLYKVFHGIQLQER